MVSEDNLSFQAKLNRSQVGLKKKAYFWRDLSRKNQAFIMQG